MQKAQLRCMDATLTNLQVWPAWQKLNRIVVSAVHEDFATGVRADDFCQTLSKCLGRDCEIAKELWLLTELRTPKLRAVAAGEAAAADLVIISVHHSESLPSEVKSWIDLWLKQKGTRPKVCWHYLIRCILAPPVRFRPSCREWPGKGRWSSSPGRRKSRKTDAGSQGALAQTNNIPL